MLIDKFGPCKLSVGESFLSQADAIAALQDGQRIRRRVNRYGTHLVFIHYRDAWRQLGRTDWYDDVATGAHERLDDPLRHYRERVRYGARVGPHWFRVIDSLSDG